MKRLFCAAAVVALIWPALSGCRGQSAPAGAPSGAAAGTAEKPQPAALSALPEQAEPAEKHQPNVAPHPRTSAGPTFDIVRERRTPVAPVPRASAGATTTDAAAQRAAQRHATERLEKLGAQLEQNDDGDVLGVAAEGLKLSTADLNRLADLPALVSLEISDTPLAEEALACVGRLVGLRRLYLKNVALTDARLEALNGLADLEVLSLPGNRITGKGLGLLSALRKIEVLNLARNPVTNEALPRVGRLPALNTLTLADTKVTGAGLVHLKPLSKLIVLNLDRCKITGDDLAHLKGHDRLRMLYVRGCKLDQEKVNELDEAISGLSIYTSGDDE